MAGDSWSPCPHTRAAGVLSEVAPEGCLISPELLLSWKPQMSPWYDGHTEVKNRQAKKQENTCMSCSMNTQRLHFW